MKRFGRSRAAAVLLACLLVAAVAGCGGSSDTGSSSTSTSGSTSSASAGGDRSSAGGGGSLTKLRVALAPGSALDLAPWIAEEQGFFAEEGLEVEATLPSVPFSQLPSALGREYDVIIGTQPDLITAGSKGLDLAAIGGINLDNPETLPGSELVVPKDSGIKSIADLAGKSVGAPSVSGNNWLTLECWAQKNGVEPDEIRGIEAPAPQITELLGDGRFDGALLFQPLLGGALAAGDVPLGDSYEECFHKPMLTSLWLSQASWAQENEDLIAAFLGGLKKAKKYMAGHSQQARQVYVERSELPEAVAKVAPIDPSVFSFEPLTVADLEPWLDLMKSLDGFEGEVDLGTLIVPGGS